MEDSEDIIGENDRVINIITCEPDSLERYKVERSICDMLHCEPWINISLFICPGFILDLCAL